MVLGDLFYCFKKRTIFATMCKYMLKFLLYYLTHPALSGSLIITLNIHKHKPNVGVHTAFGSIHPWMCVILYFQMKVYPNEPRVVHDTLYELLTLCRLFKRRVEKKMKKRHLKIFFFKC